MRIDIITVLPELLESPLNYSIVKRARDKGLVDINIVNLRDFSATTTRSSTHRPTANSSTKRPPTHSPHTKT